LKTIVISFCFSIAALISVSARTAGPDSILLYNIPEVVVQHSRGAFFNEEKKISIPDSLIRSVFTTSNLGELLPLFTGAFINTTGSSGAASVFIRGTNSYQTTVNWNGFVLNSLTLGSMDFSAIPAAAIQDISVVHGASAPLAGSGNFGGSVMLGNRADWRNSLHLGLQSELGTHGARHYSFTGKTGSQRLQYQLYLFSHDAENNFRFTDIYKNGEPVERISNNAVQNRGSLQNLFFRLPGNNNIEAGLWYQVKNKEIPAIMGSYLPGNAVQRDSSLRVYAKWTKRWEKSSFSFNTAMFDEHMLYRDKEKPSDIQYSITSGIHSRRLMGDMNYRIRVLDALSFDSGITIASLSAGVDAYGGRVNESQSAAISAMKLTLPGFTGNISVRKEFHSTTKVPLLVAIGAAREGPAKGMTFKAGYSDQFRVPTFNDKYWQPGGNPDLLPESGYTADIGVKQVIGATTGSHVVAEMSAYNSAIHNMIQWSPSGQGSFWKPENRKEVSVSGFEMSLAAIMNLDRYKLNTGGNYNHALPVVRRAENSSLEGNRLMYVPQNTASAFITISSKKSYIGLSGNYTGSRYTDEVNNPIHMMPSWFILNSFAGSRIKAGDVTGHLRLRVMNLLNLQYQVIRSYPMPGRSFHLSFTFEYNQNN
jgi:vitamin B12 transporter